MDTIVFIILQMVFATRAILKIEKYYMKVAEYLVTWRANTYYGFQYLTYPTRACGIIV